MTYIDWEKYPVTEAMVREAFLEKHVQYWHDEEPAAVAFDKWMVSERAGAGGVSENVVDKEMLVVLTDWEAQLLKAREVLDTEIAENRAKIEERSARSKGLIDDSRAKRG